MVSTGMMTGAGAGLGAGLGGALGQVVDAAAMPRKLLWQAIASMAGQEAPESGAALMSQLLGIDESDPLAQGMGMGAEVLTDPLPGLFGAAGGLAGRMMGATRGARAAEKAAEAATLGSRLERMAGGGLDRAIVGEGIRGANAAGSIAPFMDEVNPMRQFINPESMATGATRTFKNADPSLAAALEQMGLGTMGDVPGSIDINAGLKSRVGMAGRPSGPTQAIPPSFARPVSGNKAFNLVQNGELPTSFPSPDEMGMMRNLSQTVGPDAINSIHGGIDPLKALANSRYLEQKAANEMMAANPFQIGRDLSTNMRMPYTGPLSEQIAGASEGMPDWLMPLLGAGALGGGMGTAWGMGGAPMPWGGNGQVRR